jgi:hypothetical protein
MNGFEYYYKYFIIFKLCRERLMMIGFDRNM